MADVFAYAASRGACAFDNTLALADSHGLIKSTRSWHFNLNPLIIVDARYFLFVAVVVAAPAMAAPTIVVKAERDGGMVRLRATMQVDAVPLEVWDVLTDYEGQPGYMPGMTESRVITRNATGSVVALKGWMELLFLRFNFDIIYATRELQPHLLTSRVIRGNVKAMRNEYRLTPNDGGTRLDYIGEVEPEGWLPSVIGPFVIRRQVESSLESMAQEIERRQHAQSGP